MKALTYAVLSERTCGEACWCAKEDVCKCSCGGKNHGILRTPDGVQPVRTSKIDGYRYELLAVGERQELYPEIERLMGELPVKCIDQVTDTLIYTYHWQDTEKGSPIRVKYATPIQVEHWKELAQFRGLSVQEFSRKSPTLIWRRID